MQYKIAPELYRVRRRIFESFIRLKLKVRRGYYYLLIEKSIIRIVNLLSRP